MENINKNSLIIFGYSEIVTLGLVINSKLNKVKEFNILDEDNEDKFFKVISSFVSKKKYFNKIFYSCGPGSFTIIRRIISYVKALKFINCSNTKFIGFNYLYVIACYLNHNFKINDDGYIISILNHSKDNFIQIYQKKKKPYFSFKTISEIKNFDLNFIETYLETLNLSVENVYPVYLGSNPDSVSFFNNIQFVDRSNIIETIVLLLNLLENDKISQIDDRHFFEKKSRHWNFELDIKCMF